MATQPAFSRDNFISIGAVIAFVAALTIWWQITDPKARLDKVEQTAIDLSNKITITYTTLRAHEDLQARLLSDIAELKRRDEEARNLSLTKSQFEAWKTERDMYISEMMKRMDRIRSDVHDLELRTKH